MLFRSPPTLTVTPSSLDFATVRLGQSGFQVVTVAFTHANRTFANDNYLFGLSILPGKNNAALQLPLSGSGQSAKKPVKKAKTSKKAKAVRKPKKAKGPKRRLR